MLFNFLLFHNRNAVRSQTKKSTLPSSDPREAYSVNKGALSFEMNKLRCKCCKKLFPPDEVLKAKYTVLCRPCEEHCFLKRQWNGLAFVIPSTCPGSESGPAGKVN